MSNEIEIWFAQTTHILENNYFLLKLSSEMWDGGKKEKKKRTQSHHSWHWVISHPNQTSRTICSIFIKTVGSSPKQARFFSLYLQSNTKVLSICSAFMDCCKERTDRHQSEWKSWGWEVGGCNNLPVFHQKKEKLFERDILVIANRKL